MKVYIDITESPLSDHIINYFNTHKSLFPHITLMQTKHLEVSDMCTENGLVGIERKSIHDLISSIFSGKLKQQLLELKENFTFPHLLIEDYESINHCISVNKKLHHNVILGSLTSILAHSQVPYNFVGPYYTKFSLMTIEKYLDKKGELFSAEYTPQRRSKVKNDEKLNIIIGIDNIGVKDGKKVLKHFNYSIKNIIDAPIEELENIPNIGKKKAHRIKEALQ